MPSTQTTLESPKAAPAPKAASPSSSRKLRKLVNRVHLWAAVVGSLPSLLLCLSGLILVFEPELQEIEERDAARVPASGGALPLASLIQSVESATGQTVTYLRIPDKPTQSAFLATDDRNYHFADPYTGAVLKSTPRPAPLMQLVRVFHTSFFLGEFGTWIGIVSSFILVALCITGCYLFLKRKLSAKSFYQIRWSPPVRRRYDLHAIFGFVSAVPLLLIALSGALIGLGPAWRDTILFLTKSAWKPRPTLQAPVPKAEWNFNYEDALDAAHAVAPPGLRVQSISLPAKPQDPVTFRMLYSYASRPESYAFVNPANGQLIEFHHHWDYEPGHLVHRLNRGLHSGDLYTDAMRWLWFALMLIPFLLAYTGYRQWRSKQPKKPSRPTAPTTLKAKPPTRPQANLSPTHPLATDSNQRSNVAV